MKGLVPDFDPNRQFLDRLARELRPYYTPPHVPCGHDWLHVERMIQISREIRFLAFDSVELEAAAWLHNLDRAPRILELSRERGLRTLCLDYLSGSPFESGARERIACAVVEHSKRNDEADDNPLLTALRICDKVDRFRFAANTLLAIGAHRGTAHLPYDPERPYGHGSLAEPHLRTVASDFFRVLEWYAMLPSDEARALIDREDVEFLLHVVRRFGREVARHLGIEDHIEQDIQRALGPYYAAFRRQP